MRLLLLSPRPPFDTSRAKSREVLPGHEAATPCQQHAASRNAAPATARGVLQDRSRPAFGSKSPRQTALEPPLPAASADARNRKAHRIHRARLTQERVESGQSPAAWTAFQCSDRNKGTTNCCKSPPALLHELRRKVLSDLFFFLSVKKGFFGVSLLLFGGLMLSPAVLSLEGSTLTPAAELFLLGFPFT